MCRNELAYKLLAGCLSVTLKLGNPAKRFPNSATSKPAGLFSTLSLMLNVKQGRCEYQF